MTLVELQPAGGDEIALLGEVLAELLAEQEVPQFARAVGRLRSAAEEMRAGRPEAGLARLRFLEEIPSRHVEPYVRACGMQLKLANLAEERERVSGGAATTSHCAPCWTTWASPSS
jgi:phosphoenolpyruvate carboxylase